MAKIACTVAPTDRDTLQASYEEETCWLIFTGVTKIVPHDGFTIGSVTFDYPSDGEVAFVEVMTHVTNWERTVIPLPPVDGRKRYSLKIAALLDEEDDETYVKWDPSNRIAMVSFSKREVRGTWFQLSSTVWALVADGLLEALAGKLEGLKGV